MKIIKQIFTLMLSLTTLCIVIHGCGSGGSNFHKQQGIEYYSKGMYDKAIDEFNTQIKNNPKDAMTHYNLGLAYYANNMQKEAALELKKAVEISPNLVKKIDEEYKTAQTPAPQNANAFNVLGLAYADKGMYDQAITAYMNALSADPDDAEIHYNLALAYRGKGLTDMAADEYRKVVAINPEHVEAHYNLATTYRRKGMAEQAIMEFNQVLTLLSPNQKKRLAATHLNLGQIYIAEGGVDTAIQEYNKALELYPNYSIARAALQDANKKRKGVY